ncbi:MAG: valine--tRNA ligase [Endomicrobium sp.]|nr:valine--tRNA ligase [Endomicrobium sp.]
MKKVYDHNQIDEKWYKFWVNNKTYKAKIDKKKKAFSIVIPPPNITGSLHMGHALNVTLQDVILRFKRIQGYNTLWIPGVDHGGIATQNIVEKNLKRNGQTKLDLGYDNFLEKIWLWKSETSYKITNQLKKMGCCLDWDRETFTMDEKCSKAVKKAFIKLFNNGLIYKGKKLINWCFKCGTALSDIELEYKKEITKLWYIKYFLQDMKNDYITIATTRPETIFGDTAIAVSPNDNRYKKLINKIVIVPIINKKIKIIADYKVDKTFGTGAIKVTPGHDVLDNEIALKNNLDILEIINNDGKMINVPIPYTNLYIHEAKEKIIKDLNDKNYFIKIEDYEHSIGTCYRCSSKIESLISEQWFLNVSSMSKKAITIVNNKKISFYPKSWIKPYILWLKNLKDWCISRQIWWGHKIPIYYCINKTCPPVASFETPIQCPKCGGKILKQETDVLDTWFSSALWPFSVFNWGNNNNDKDLKYFYPTSVLVTGYEILYLWVARMIQFSLLFMNNIPFKDIIIHGIVRDKYGKKMSKSIGNVIDPIIIMKEYGTDALRFALMHSAVQGRDIRISNEMFISSRNFINKIWNATRFIMLNLSNTNFINVNSNYIKCYDIFDEWIITELQNLTNRTKKAYENYNIDIVAKEVYDFFWTKFCNWYIEFAKIKIFTFPEKKEDIMLILVYILNSVLKIISPIIPFITSEVFQIIKNSNAFTSNIFKLKLKISNNNITYEQIHKIQDIITKIRMLRLEINIASNVSIELIFNNINERDKNFIENNKNYIKYIVNVNSIKFEKNIKNIKGMSFVIAGDCEIFLPIYKYIDINKEKNRLNKNIRSLQKEISLSKTKLQNSNFLRKASKLEINKTKEKLYAAQIKMKKIINNLKIL